MAGWNIPLFDRKYVFKGSIFQPAMLVYRSVLKISAFLFEGKYLNTFPKPSFFDTPPKFNMAPEKSWLEFSFPLGNGIFSGAMLNFQGVSFGQNPWINYSSNKKQRKSGC